MPRSGHQIRYVAVALLAILALVGLLCAAAVAILANKVVGHSMQPTLRNGQRFFVTPGSASRLKRFDVIVLHANRGGDEIVKRVVGLPGDRILITSAPSYEVLIQPGGTGQWFLVDEPAWQGQATKYVACCSPDGLSQGKPQAQTVPAGSLYVLGDNPDESTDSRTFGWAEQSGVVGRVGVRVWPLGAGFALGNRPTLHAVSAPAGS